MLSISGATSDIQPVTEFGRNDVEEGVCEYCGIFSNELMFQNGKWVCKECEELEY